ncbi:anti-Muellerian hormone type-2 receptor isoform X2 [Pseudophryne corroboree]|uniref:anti-Muellerian hormone type-2 receptor isoform X2 n=1 Tax=Pseudophryne corroboree TaxID=495146 RepID=UPI003081FD73
MVKCLLPLHVIGMSHKGFIVLLIIFSVLLPDVHPKGISCALHENASYPVGLPMAKFGDVKEPGKIRCNESNCCMGVWIISNGEFQPVVLGCFPSHAVCRSELCVPEYREDKYHCLCSSDMCNDNISLSQQHFPRDHVAVYVAIVLLVLCIIIVPIVKKLKLSVLVRREDLLAHQETPMQGENSPPTLPVEGLILHKVFSSSALQEEDVAAHLWLGDLYGKGVIIKCFPPTSRKLYSQEWRILNLLMPLQHENIVCFLAAGTGTAGILEHQQFLVLQHYPEGSLKRYLTGRTTDWDIACRMAISLARGLAFLHTNIQREGIWKPAIAHRDLSSDNILVNADSSCVISDFGLSVVLEDYQMKKKPQEPAPLNMTGTLRYMSPEMLDGSLNLKSWELALTQVDVYSLGLLLWEIFSRCNDLYADHQSPEFRVVFLDELGSNPSLDELRSLVVENKQRPQLPKNWNKNLQLYKTLCETLEDCWDPDNDARLTAQCAEQRLCDLFLMPFSLLPEDALHNNGNI